MDAFSEILSGIRLRGAMFFNAEFSAPWAVESPGSAALAPTLAPGAQYRRRRVWPQSPSQGLALTAVAGSGP